MIMKRLTILAAILFAGSAAAVECTDCHAPINIDEHTEMEATIATCNDCHDFKDNHELDMDMHTPELTIKECADCHE